MDFPIKVDPLVTCKSLLIEHPLESHEFSIVCKGWDFTGYIPIIIKCNQTTSSPKIVTITDYVVTPELAILYINENACELQLSPFTIEFTIQPFYVGNGILEQIRTVSQYGNNPVNIPTVLPRKP